MILTGESAKAAQELDEICKHSGFETDELTEEEKLMIYYINKVSESSSVFRNFIHGVAILFTEAAFYGREGELILDFIELSFKYEGGDEE